MKNIIFLSTTLLFCGFLSAQPVPEPPESPSPQMHKHGPPAPDMEKLKTLLELSDEQAVSLETFFKERRDEREAGLEEARQQREATREAERKALAQILNEEQMKKLDALRPHPPEGREEGNRQRGMPGGCR